MEHLFVHFFNVMAFFVLYVGSVLGDRRHDISCHVPSYVDKKLRADFLGKDKIFVNGMCTEKYDKYPNQMSLPYTVGHFDSSKSDNFVAPQGKSPSMIGDRYKGTATGHFKMENKKQTNQKKLKGSKKQRKQKKKKKKKKKLTKKKKTS